MFRTVSFLLLLILLGTLSTPAGMLITPPPVDVTARYGKADVQFNYVSITRVALSGYNGKYLDVKDELKAIDSSTAADQVDTTDNLITATGADAGVAMSASTLYYCYKSNSLATTFPSDVRCSTTGYTSYRGGQYLAATGNGTNWRLIGLVYTDASTHFVDTLSQRFVLSWFNRRQLIAETSGTTAYPTTSLTYVELNSAVRAEFITWAGINTTTTVTVTVDNGTVGNILYVSNGIDGTVSGVESYVNEPVNGYDVNLIAMARSSLTVGYHYNTIMVKTPSGGTSTYRRWTTQVIGIEG